MGWELVPFQSSAHEPFFAVCRKARVKYRAPELRATAGIDAVSGAR